MCNVYLKLYFKFEDGHVTITDNRQFAGNGEVYEAVCQDHMAYKLVNAVLCSEKCKFHGNFSAEFVKYLRG